MSSVTWARADGTPVPGLAYGPLGAPGVVALQEWWGIVPSLTQHAEKIAASGYRVYVPNLYRGEGSYEVNEAQHNFKALDWQGAVADTAGAARALKAEGSPKVGVIGFCMGGALALATGCLAPDDVACCVGAYGTPSAELCNMATSRTPSQGHFGAQDKSAGFSDAAAADALEAALAASPAAAQSVVYRYGAWRGGDAGRLQALTVGSRVSAI